MDFHAEFEKSIQAFPNIEGLIFADPDGEFILFEAPTMEDFDVKLAGAKMPIMLQAYRFAGINRQPQVLEIFFGNRYVITICLVEQYTITAVARNLREKGRLRRYLLKMAAKFNQEIV